MALTSEQVQIIRSTVPVLRDHGVAITASFYSTLLSDVPELNDVFNQASQANNHQATALANALYAYASHIDDLGTLSPAVEKICQKHASLFIRPDQYKVVGEYLLRAMGEVLGSAMTKEILDAWGVAYWQLANLMIKREDQLLQDANGWTDWREFEIADKVKESEEITSFYLKPLDGQKLPSFLPGQYISVMTKVRKLDYLQARQYSLSDAPSSKYYRVSVKKELDLNHKEPNAETHPGYVSNVLHDEKKVGDTVKVSHPAGEFFFSPAEDKNSPIVLLSAGVGLTPMISILNTLTEEDSRRPVSFTNGSRSTLTRAFHSYLQTKASCRSNLTYSTFVKNADTDSDSEDTSHTHSGRLSLSKLNPTNDLFLDNKSTKYFVCGPNSFMADIRNGLIDMGVDGDRIKREVFGTGMTLPN